MDISRALLLLLLLAALHAALLLLLLVSQARFGELRGKLGLLFAEDKMLVNIALIDLVDIGAALIRLFFEHCLDLFRIVA